MGSSLSLKPDLSVLIPPELSRRREFLLWLMAFVDAPGYVELNINIIVFPRTIGTQQREWNLRVRGNLNPLAKSYFHITL